MAKIYHAILDFISNLWGRLFSMREESGEREPLTKFSIFIVILLDIFLFYLVYTWISEQTKVIDLPDQYANYNCREIIEKFSSAEILNTQNSLVQSISSWYYSVKNNNSYTDSVSYDYSGRSRYSSYNSYNYESSAPTCKNLRKLLDESYADTELKKLIADRSLLDVTLSRLEGEVKSILSTYDTKLLEKIAGSNPKNTPEDGTADTAKENLDTLRAKIADLEAKIASNTQLILRNSSIIKVINLSKSEGPDVQRKYSYLTTIYPAKVFGVQVLFLLPLLATVIFWSNWALRRGRTYQLLIASHTLGVLMIFVFLKICELVYELIPHTFLTRIFNVLETFKLTGLWYYFLVILSIGTTLGIIYMVQRRIRAATLIQAAQIRKTRASKWDCHACGTQLPKGAIHCISCGAAQYTPCIVCTKPTLVWGNNCMHCGSTQEI